MLKKYKDLIISIAFPLIIGFIIALITRGGINNLDNLTKPSFMPPNMLFGIVWTILYTLLGISSYLIKKSYSCYSNTCLLIYYTQLFVNFMWPIIFFSLEFNSLNSFSFSLDTYFRFIGYIYDMVFLWYKKRSCLYLDTICFMAYICNILKL